MIKVAKMPKLFLGRISAVNGQMCFQLRTKIFCKGSSITPLHFEGLQMKDHGQGCKKMLKSRSSQNCITVCAIYFN